MVDIDLSKYDMLLRQSFEKKLGKVAKVVGLTIESIGPSAKLNDLCHALDMTRPTVMADVFMLETDSPMLEIPDMNSYNLYFGWYLGCLLYTSPSPRDA